MKEDYIVGEKLMGKSYILLLGTGLIMNILGYLSMWSDKRRAIKGKYRISEKTLFIIAILGGSIGSILGMQRFRHKTKHWYFKYGMPFILIVQILIAIFLYNYFCV